MENEKADLADELLKEAHEHHHHHHHHHDHDEECECGCHDHDHHHHHADEVFISWGRETAKKYSREDLEKILAELSKDSDEYGIVLRAKGMLPDAAGEWHYFDMVPEETEIRTGAPEFTGRICVIGSKLKEDKLTELFGL